MGGYGTCSTGQDWLRCWQRGRSPMLHSPRKHRLRHNRDRRRVSATGIYAANGNNTKNGYEFAVKKINDAGGVTIGGKCYHFKIKYYDDESTPARAAQLIERLIDQDKIKYMLGPYGSPLAKAILPVIEKYKTPLVQAEAASRSLFTQGYKYHFGIIATSEKYLAPVVDMAADIAKKAGKDPRP